MLELRRVELPGFASIAEQRPCPVHWDRSGERSVFPPKSANESINCKGTLAIYSVHGWMVDSGGSPRAAADQVFRGQTPAGTAVFAD